MRTWIGITAVLVGLLFSAPAANASDLPLIEPCIKSQILPCVESFSVVDEFGKVFEARLTGNSWPTREYFASQYYSGTDYEWEVPGISQPNGNQFFKLLGEYFPLNTPYCWLPNQSEATCDRTIDEIALWVYPSMRYSTPPPAHFPKLSSDKICGGAENPTLCFITWDLNPKLKYQVKMKIPNSFDSGMMAANGKTGSAKAIIESDGSRSVLFKGEATENLWTINNPPLSPPADENSTAVMGRIELAFFLQSKLSAQSQWANRCNKGEIVTYWHNTGIGTTPTWSSAENSIVMETGGPHFKADGSLNTGLIELQIPVPMAQCLWGVDLSRKVSATMTATYGNGTTPEVIATRSAVAENVFTLTSSGFHYSNPKIAVKLEQDKGVTQEPIAATSLLPKPTITKKITIVCKKAKTIKKISGSSPKCPAGFKKQ